MSAARTRGASLVACAGLACMLAAPAASPYPEGYAPFQGKGPAVFRTYPCRPVAAGRRGAEGDEAAAKRCVEYVRGDGRPARARVRLSRGEGAESGAVLMSVLDPDGRVLAGPQRIADAAVVIPPAFWADLNGDGREDFVALVVTAIGGSACACDVGFALSSEKEYRITGVRSTRGPGANDFLDLGEGRVGFVHTALVERRDPARKDAPADSYFVISLLEVKGGRLVLAEADPRFPKWVRVAAKPGRAEETTLAEAEKERIWSEVAARILRDQDADEAPTVASAPE